MTTRFESYGRTSLGRRLASIINAPERYSEYRVFSREGFPAMTALVLVVRPELEPLQHSDRREFDAAKQFMGWAVGRIMRDHGHKAVRTGRRLSSRRKGSLSPSEWKQTLILVRAYRTGCG
jgi:hypothetical protein